MVGVFEGVVVVVVVVVEVEVLKQHLVFVEGGTRWWRSRGFVFLINDSSQSIDFAVVF